MCGRINQHRRRATYANAIGWEGPDLSRSKNADDRAAVLMKCWGPNRIPFYNMPPGLFPDVMHTLHEGRPQFDTIHWGYQPPWAKDKGLPMSINARLETAATKPFFRHMFAQGRVIVPANGWFEWTGDTKPKQPWYIRLKTDSPMFLAAITNFRPFTHQDKQVGFVIITAATDGGLVDVHDRRPVVFSPEDARLWMDNALLPEQADTPARTRSMPPNSFEWYKVSTVVNNARNNIPEAIVSLRAQS